VSEKDNSVPLFSPFEIERQARIKRSLVVQSCLRGTMRAFAEWFRTFVLRSSQLARGLAAQRHIYSHIREQIPRNMGHWRFVSSARLCRGHGANMQ
jgi:hypothetical protein